MADAALALPDDHNTSTSGRGPQRVYVPRHQLPLDLLVAPAPGAQQHLARPADLIRMKRDVRWAQGREQLLAAAALGVHVALFAFNIAFWGFEGVPPDRYWPENPRWKLGIRPKQYGNLFGAQKLYWYYLEKLHGGKG